MFISTNRVFPEGAVLNVRFRLAHTQAEVQTRCEVRHRLPGVGIGVEFIGLTSEAEHLIAREIAFETRGVHRQKKPGAKKNSKAGKRKQVENRRDD